MDLSKWQSDDAIKRCLETRRVAVVGLSSNPARPSFGVGKYLLHAGYQIVPVNPKEDEILGLTCYPDLESIPGKIDLVDVFRQSDAVLSIAESAIAIGAKGLWLQLGVYHLRALALARSAGLTCVTDKCTKVEHQTLSLQGWSR